MKQHAKVAVLPAPNASCQRIYRLTVAVVASATMPDAGVTAAVMLPDVAPVNAAKLAFRLVSASSSESVTVPLLVNNW